MIKKFSSRIDGSELLLDIDPNKKYGILLSGGLDSAVLLYLIIREFPRIDLQPFTIPKKDGAILYADPIISHINNKFNLKIPKTIAVGDPTVHHRKQNKSAVIDIFQKHSVDFLFIAINQNPPELTDLPGAPIRTKRVRDSRIILPFVDLIKTHIVDLMFEYSQEDLMAITHSCTEQPVGRCSQCWQCSERAWAFSSLNKIDNGEI